MEPAPKSQHFQTVTVPRIFKANRRASKTTFVNANLAGENSFVLNLKKWIAFAYVWNNHITHSNI